MDHPPTPFNSTQQRAAVRRTALIMGGIALALFAFSLLPLVVR